MPDMAEIKKDWEQNVKLNQSSLIKSVYFTNETISVNVYARQKRMYLLLLVCGGIY